MSSNSNSAEWFWVIVEGQNFDFAIFDSQDLSTIRGGSLLFRNGILEAENILMNKCELEIASNGGSRGIWRVYPTAGETITKVLKALRTGLSKGAYSHIPFAIAAVVDDGRGYLAAASRLKASVQRQRYRASSTIYPATGAQDGQVCTVDMVRPTAPGRRFKRPGDSAGYPVSASVYDRRRYGIEMKQRLLADLKIADLLHEPSALDFIQSSQGSAPFAHQINSISERKSPFSDRRKLRSNLADKVCVIHMDGNGFGEIQSRVLERSDTAAQQRAFDSEVQELRRRLVARVFDTICEQKGYGKPSAEESALRVQLGQPEDIEVSRFECLLWGGDETTFIVPARLGWSVMETIADVIGNQQIDGKPVSFATGAVFCHHDSPISRIKELADGLASFAKSTGVDAAGNARNGRKLSLFAPVVMESFDHAGSDIDRFMKNRLPLQYRAGEHQDALALDAALSGLVMTSEEIKLLHAVAMAISSGVEGQAGAMSRSGLRSLAMAIHYGIAPLREAGRNADAYLQSGLSQIANHLPAGAREAFSPQRLFMLLEDYWDYLLPLEEDGTAGTGASR